MIYSYESEYTRMNPIDGLFSTFGSSQAALPADANAPDKLQPVGSGV